ncbi:MAG: VWA domain-containing protein [Nitrospiraceae bacterium]
MNDTLSFPFSALVGQEPMKRALLVNAMYPRVGGVLIMGQRGSAKSTAARALANLLPPVAVPRGCPLVCDPEAPEGWCLTCRARGTSSATEKRPTPFVSLPIGATQDRVVGTLDLEGAVMEGKKRWEPGLLARAHRGMLYIDEVNLLPDHLVDLLLDVAASGINTVEREGISLSHPSRFILVGTMNPDEGDLRPQLLDRFGLCVEVETLCDTTLRAEVVSRTLAFESDPEQFWAEWKEAEETLRQRLVSAREQLQHVRLPPGFAHRIAELCCKEQVEGLRADIIIQKTCLALAAWAGREVVNEADLEEAARLTLLHRRKPSPEPPPQTRPPNTSSKASESKRPEDIPAPKGDRGQDRTDDSPMNQDLQEHQPGQPSSPRRLPTFPSSSSSSKPGPLKQGRHRDRRMAPLYLGPVIGFTFPTEHPVRTLAVPATLRAAAGRQADELRSGSGARRLTIRPQDFRIPVHERKSEWLYVFVLDTSGSMGAKRRMEVTKGLVIGLLETAYRKRDRVALLAFAGLRSRLVLPPTRSVRRAQRLLHDLPVGGRTPMADALQQARHLVMTARRKDLQQVVVVISDGRSNVAGRDADPLEAAMRELALLAQEKVPVILLDAEEGPVRLGLMRYWSMAFGCVYTRLSDLETNGVHSIRMKASKTA